MLVVGSTKSNGRALAWRTRPIRGCLEALEEPPQSLSPLLRCAGCMCTRSRLYFGTVSIVHGSTDGSMRIAGLVDGRRYEESLVSPALDRDAGSGVQCEESREKWFSAM